MSKKYMLVEESGFSLREPVAAFAVEMEDDLKVNDSEGGWSWSSNEYLYTRAKKCFGQLFVELFEGTTNIASLREERVREHTVQCANYLMMIADNWGGLVPGPCKTDKITNVNNNLVDNTVTVERV